MQGVFGITRRPRLGRLRLLFGDPSLAKAGVTTPLAWGFRSPLAPRDTVIDAPPQPPFRTAPQPPWRPHRGSNRRDR